MIGYYWTLFHFFALPLFRDGMKWNEQWRDTVSAALDEL